MSEDLRDDPLRVLVVDDHEAQRRTLCDILVDEGYHVVGCASAAEALELLTIEDFQIAVLDQRLPDLTGTELLERMERLSPGLRAIIYTAYGSDEIAHRAHSVGAFAYVEKASDPAELVHQVHNAEQDVLCDALVGSNARLRVVLENAPDWILQTDRHGTILYCNRPAPGSRADDTLGSNLIELIAAEDRIGARRAFVRALGSAMAESCGRVRLTGAGEPRHDWKVAPVVVGRRVVAAIHSLRELTPEPVH
jgi:CheY-like chemotaxis protein